MSLICLIILFVNHYQYMPLLGKKWSGLDLLELNRCYQFAMKLICRVIHDFHMYAICNERNTIFVKSHHLL